MVFEKNTYDAFNKWCLNYIFGGLTIYFNDPVFLYVKPTIINILFALALYFGKYFTNEPVLKKIMGKSIALTDMGWELLNKRWMYFSSALQSLMNASGEHKQKNFGLTLRFGECCQ